MHKIFVVAKMVFKKRVLSPTYYWMILAPILLIVIGIGFTKYIDNQNSDHKAIIAVVADKNIQEALKKQKASTYKVNSKINTHNKNKLKIDLADGVVDGIIYINNDFSKVDYKYNASTDSSDPTNELKKNITLLKSQYMASNAGLSENQWQNIIKDVKVRKENVNYDGNTVKLNNSESAQYFSEFAVIIAFFFLTSYISITGAEIGNEKGNHLIEGLTAAIPADKHYAGKMIGIFYLIGFQLIIYSVLGGLGYLILKNMHKQFIDLNKYLSGISAQYIIVVVMLTVVSLALYIFLAAIFASFVSKVEDISQATSSVASLMLIPYFLSFLTQSNPNLAISKILSYVPYMSQGLMPVRIARGAATYRDGYISLLISIVCVIIMYLFSAKVYKNNVFSYSSETPVRAILKRVTK
ncbi:ABC transporter permease [Limosilactobacillus sp. STM2_1]|uniref:ABC transporter permease n=1 Tax=Limosilactobacillus rudii TaxID=2759755 RepID=A0A7W3ULE3_9LACO|nr:ABC transporter permease [Limosilactobacillus rudii]MBB1079644.1 ABC transporter permease [Limosilactobacillus rudii]MBB1097722.1 ABC transporter permease [Limosilactobacillus rudii]MCD7134366.1 ABC transporter permease [Limosilactobacillus rudii]